MKIQISLRISAVWSESSQGALRIAKDPKHVQADSEDWSDCVNVQADMGFDGRTFNFEGSALPRLRADPGRFMRGLDLIKFPYFLYVFGQTGLSKQCWPRSDAAERGVWSGSTLFATHPTILHTFAGRKIDLLKRNIMLKGQEVWIFRVNTVYQNLSKVSKISYEKEILGQKGLRLNPLWIRPWDRRTLLFFIHIFYVTWFTD